MSDLPEHISIWGELADTDHELRHVNVRGVRTRVLRAGSGPAGPWRTSRCCDVPRSSLDLVVSACRMRYGTSAVRSAQVPCCCAGA